MRKWDDPVLVKVLKEDGTSNADVLEAVRKTKGVEWAVEYERSAEYDELRAVLREVGERLWRMEGIGDRKTEEMRRLIEKTIDVDFRNIPRSKADVGVR